MLSGLLLTIHFHDKQLKKRVYVLGAAGKNTSEFFSENLKRKEYFENIGVRVAL